MPNNLPTDSVTTSAHHLGGNTGARTVQETHSAIIATTTVSRHNETEVKLGEQSTDSNPLP